MTRAARGLAVALALLSLGAKAPIGAKALLSRPAVAPRGPPYPIVLVHGFFLNVHAGPIDYWWRIPEALRAAGEQVFLSSQEPLRPPVDRARQLATAVDEALRVSGAAKVNLICHSLGGLDARVLVSALGYGDRVASITTVGTPHRGSPIADFVLEVFRGDLATTAAAWANAIGKYADGDDQDALGTAHALSTEGAAAFNAKYPDDPRVAYFSVVARTSDDVLFLSRELDLCDALFWPSFWRLKTLGYASDGLVTTESQRWGEVVAEIQADHENQIGHPLGAVGFAFDPWTFYVDHARFLHLRGY